MFPGGYQLGAILIDSIQFAPSCSVQREHAKLHKIEGRAAQLTSRQFEKLRYQLHRHDEDKRSCGGSDIILQYLPRLPFHLDGAGDFR